MAQNCTQAGQLLAAPNTATVTPTQFNTVKNATHPLILQDLAPKCDTRIPPDEEMPKALINGRPVKLPIGAYPKFFSFDGVRWGIPPAGTLQGFFYNNQTYFADIESGTQQFNGYRTFAGSCDKPDPNLFYVAPTGTLQNVYYFERYFSSATNTACGYRFIESTYTFNLSQGPNSSVALPLLTGHSNNELILQNCGSMVLPKAWTIFRVI